MAVTSLWHISGKLKDLLDYVENPEKTVALHPELSDPWNVARYVERPAATADGAYVTAINCLKETALRQMILTKRQYGKEDGYIAYHGYQSFMPGEVAARECHEIGVETARELWGDRFQIIVTTHLDKGHLHNHFLFNSVSFRDGKKYNYSKQERQRMVEVSDRICLEHGLPVLQKQRKAPSRPVYYDEKDGKPTRYNVYRQDLWEAIAKGRSLPKMEAYLHRLGYVTDFTGKHWKIRLPQYQHFTRLDTLDERLTPAFIQQNLGKQARYGSYPAQVSFPSEMPEGLRHVWQPKKPTSHLRRLYLYWCYQLGILPKGTKCQPTSPILREELRRLDAYDREVRYLAANRIETAEDLQAHISTEQEELDRLMRERTQLYKQMRRASPERKEELKKQRDCLSKQISALRRDLKTARSIETHSQHIDQTMNLVYENEVRTREQNQRRSNNEREVSR